MHKICLTGGPCGGKSTALAIMKQRLEDRGFTVILVPEAATKIIMMGFTPNSVGLDAFQTLINQEQLNNEIAVEEFSKKLSCPPDKIVVLFDRGEGDQIAYEAYPGQVSGLLKKAGLTKAEAYANYDAVIHLQTAAIGAAEHYQWNDPSKEETGNNAARFTSPEQAIADDSAIINAWIGHPHLRIINNSTDFDKKMDRCFEEIVSVIGDPMPLEIERKLLIKTPTKEQLDSLGGHKSVHITQVYLDSDDQIERRVRMRGSGLEGYTYYYTEKQTLSDGTRREVERMIDAEEYAIHASREADKKLAPINKDRELFVYKDQYFEMDTYIPDAEFSILELETHSLNDPIDLPDWIEIIADVTLDNQYKNRDLAELLSDITNLKDFSGANLFKKRDFLEEEEDIER